VVARAAWRYAARKGQSWGGACARANEEPPIQTEVKEEWQRIRAEEKTRLAVQNECSSVLAG